MPAAMQETSAVETPVKQAADGGPKGSDDALLDGVQEFVKQVSALVATDSLALVKSCSAKYKEMFNDLHELVKKDERLAEDILSFALHFQPMNDAAFEYVLGIRAYADNLKCDIFPSLVEALEKKDRTSIASLLDDMLADAKPFFHAFQQTTEGYKAVMGEATKLRCTADLQVHQAETRGNNAANAQVDVDVAGAGWAVGQVVSAVAVCATPVAAPMVPLMLLVAGGAAVGTAVAHHCLNETKCTQAEIMRSGEVLHRVISEIDDLCATHMKQLIEIKNTMQKIIQGSSRVSDVAKTAPVFDESKVIRITRLLDKMNKDIEELDSECAEYIETEKASQNSVAKELGVGKEAPLSLP